MSQDEATMGIASAANNEQPKTLQNKCGSCKQLLYGPAFNIDKTNSVCKACDTKRKRRCAYRQKVMKKREEYASKMTDDIVQNCRTCRTCKEYLSGTAYHTATKHKYYNCKACEAKRLREYRLKKQTEREAEDDEGRTANLDCSEQKKQTASDLFKECEAERLRKYRLKED